MSDLERDSLTERAVAALRTDTGGEPDAAARRRMLAKLQVSAAVGLGSAGASLGTAAAHASRIAVFGSKPFITVAAALALGGLVGGAATDVVRTPAPVPNASARIQAVASAAGVRSASSPSASTSSLPTRAESPASSTSNAARSKLSPVAVAVPSRSSSARRAHRAQTSTYSARPTASAGNTQAELEDSLRSLHAATKEPTKGQAATSPIARLGEQQTLLDRARSALGHGRYADVLAIIDEHAARFPSSVFVEEREALAIKALSAAGESDRARSRAKRFEARFPNSIQLRTVRRSLGGRE